MIITGTGIFVEGPNPDALDARMRAADRPGQHLWIVTLAYGVADPERVLLGQVTLDTENLLMTGGPGCFKCERKYSRKLAKMPCTGSVDEPQ